MKMKILILPLLFCIFGFTVPSKQEFSKAFINVAEVANPAIVSIISETVVEQNFHFFNPWGEIPKQEYKGQSLGSGVIINAQEGYVVTNNHVVKDAEEIKILLEDNRELLAEVVGTDPLSDIALLRVKSNDLIDVKLGDSEKLKVGEWVMAIGSPFGIHLNHTVTAGIVSAIGRSDIISRRNFENFIQHDAAINPGNSGGALLNLDGELIGINTAIATEGFTRQSAGVGFAIPIKQVMRVVNDLISEGQVIRGWLGVSIQDIDEQMARALKLDTRNGAIIAQILEDSPADKSGLQNQDIILEIDGTIVENSSHLKNIIASNRPTESVVMKILRNNKNESLNVRLGKRPDENNLADSFFQNNSYDKLGLKVSNIDIENNSELVGVKIIAVKEGSDAQDADLRKGDVISKIGEKEIVDISDYTKLLGKYNKGDSILLYVKRNNSSRFVGLEIN